MLDDTTTPKHAGPSIDSARVALRCRVVREARRHTWFVVNEGSAPLVQIPLDLMGDGPVRRAEVNGELAEFDVEDDARVLVTPRRALRSGAGTIIVLHLR